MSGKIMVDVLLIFENLIEQGARGGQAREGESLKGCLIAFTLTPN